MTKSWRSYAEFREIDQDWQWPDMNPWKVIIKDDPEASRSLVANPIGTGVAKTTDGTQDAVGQAFTTNTNETSAENYGYKSWDVNDPALTLDALFSSKEWINQTLVPGSDFTNLLRVLRPVDHAFFTTLFLNQSPSQREAAHKDNLGNSPNLSPTYINNQYGCGTWISEYSKLQRGILDETQQSRYLLHTCPMIPSATNYGATNAFQADESQQQMQPCGDIFSQMLAMTSAFIWSVIESRGFFLNLDQIQELQESFDQSLLQHWTSPPKADSTATINTSDMTTKDLDRLFRLDDPLLNHYANSNDEGNKQADEEVINRLRGIRSKSRNRVSFERTMTPNDPLASYMTENFQWNPKSQERQGQDVDPLKMEKLIRGLNQDGIELVLDHDLLPQIVNTSRTFNQLTDLNIPLPTHILRQTQQNQNRNDLLNEGGTRGNIPIVHAPHAHGSLFGSVSSSPLSLSSNPADEDRISAAFHTAIHDERDPSRIQAVPKTFGCLLDTLIQPKIELKELIHPYATLFKLPAIFSVGIFIKSTQQPVYGSTSWKSISDGRKATVNRYMTCARQIAREFAPKRKGQKVVFVVVSEDTELAKMMESQEEWDEEVIAPKWVLPKSHSQQQQRQSEPMVSRQQQAVLENWVLSKTDFQVVSDYSNFAKVAVWRTRRQGRSIVIRENPVLEKEMETKRGYVDMMDCGMLLKNLIVTD
ncbi:hypothetical protein BGZ76_009216 [Entomortierella beljakovae]|nr:hypothetical protein BGZ76_009216 [Entomortierella beljakovae]